MSCGEACVRQLLRDERIEIAEEVVRQATGCSGDGTRPPDLRDALNQWSLHQWNGGGVEPEALEVLADGCPFLALLKFPRGEHWVIVDSVSQEAVSVRDPRPRGSSVGLVGSEGTLDRKTFDELWMMGVHRVVYRLSG